MDTAAVARIRASFNLLAPRGQELVDLFYSNLFSQYPTVRGMFPADMSQQKQHLLAAVGLVVKNADNFGALERPLMEMGARHVGYGVQDEHYPLVRDNMLKTLSQLAGPAWNAQLTADWTEALNAVAATMIKGAAGVKVKKAA